MHIRQATTQHEQYDSVLCVIGVDEVCATACEDDFWLKGKHHFSRMKLIRMSFNDSPPPLFHFISISTCWCDSRPLACVAMETWCVIKIILPPLAIHLLLSISSCWMWLDWCWVLHAATFCFTCLNKRLFRDKECEHICKKALGYV